MIPNLKNLLVLPITVVRIAGSVSEQLMGAVVHAVGVKGLKAEAPAFLGGLLISIVGGIWKKLE
jgi:hypothetical protein